MKKILFIIVAVLLIVSCGQSNEPKVVNEANNELVGEWKAVHYLDSLFADGMYISSKEYSFSREVAIEHNEYIGWPKLCFNSDNTVIQYDYDPIKNEYIEDANKSTYELFNDYLLIVSNEGSYKININKVDTNHFIIKQQLEVDPVRNLDMNGVEAYSYVTFERQ
jgi:lipocalin